MTQTILEQIKQSIDNLRMDMMEIKARLGEEYELSDEARKELAEARKTMKREFASHEEIMKRFG